MAQKGSEFKLWIPSAREVDSTSGSSYTIYEIHVQVNASLTCADGHSLAACQTAAAYFTLTH